MKDFRIVSLPEISVIGKVGLCTKDHNIVQDLWKEANEHFGEIADLAMKNPDGTPVGCWGAMSDETMSFQPWTEGFRRGLYLAGVETVADARAPQGWTKWTLPKRTYLVVDVSLESYAETFRDVLENLLPSENLRLAGAVCDYTQPSTGKNQLFFPVEVHGS